MLGALKPIIHPYQAITVVQLCPCHGSGSGPNEHGSLLLFPRPPPSLDICAISLIIMATIKTHPCVTNAND